jgi:predicted DNA-binding transcriptional regulator YafY
MIMNNKKSRILYVKRFLETQTDERNPVEMRDILYFLEKEGIHASRKTVMQDIEQLIEAGIDVVCNKGRHYEFFVGSRHFELPELKTLVDAVQASKFITAKKSSALIDKLTNFASIHQAGELNRQIYVGKHIKQENERTYITVDMLHNAINAENQITFKYYEYNRYKKRDYKHNRYTYTFSPYALLWNSDKYYAVGYSDKHGKVITFRVDRIAMPKLSDKPAVPKPKGFDIKIYTKSVFQMYDGAEIQKVTLKCENSLMKSIIDRFGEDVETEIFDDEHFNAVIEVSVSPTFFGWVFSFGGEIEIIYPESVKSGFTELAKKH